MHRAADGCFNVYRRIQTGFGQAARQHDMTIQYGARRVGDGIVLIVALRQHRIEGRDGPDAAIAVAGTLHQLRQPREHRGWIAFGGGRFADRQRDLTLRLREARQRVEQQQHLESTIAKILGDGGRQPGTVQPHQGGIVRGCRHDDRAAHAVGAERVADEILHLAAAFADQANHRDVGLRIARHHAEQYGFADAGSGEQPNALSAADGEQRIDGAHADIERIADRTPHQGIQRLAGQRHAVRTAQLTHAVERPAGSVQHPSQ